MWVKKGDFVQIRYDAPEGAGEFGTVEEVRTDGYKGDATVRVISTFYTVHLSHLTVCSNPNRPLS